MASGSELCELRWDQVDLRAGLIHVIRNKNGVPPIHPLNGDDVRGLRQLRRDWSDGRHVFVTERDAVHKIGGSVKWSTVPAGKQQSHFQCISTCSGNAAGYYYANRGEDTRALQLWLGHRSMQHTVRYTELNAERFKDW